MTINKLIIKKLQIIYQKAFSPELVNYLMDKYRKEPFPYEYSGQDLFNSIRVDINRYYEGKLDITVLSPYEKLKKERDIYLSACITSELENDKLMDRIRSLELILETSF